MIAANRQIAEDFKVHGTSTAKGYFFSGRGGTLSNPTANRTCPVLVGCNRFERWLDLAVFCCLARNLCGQRDSGRWRRRGQALNPLRLCPIGKRDTNPIPTLITTTIATTASRPSLSTLAIFPVPDSPETAPAGYQLNKLRRDARAPPLRSSDLLFALSQTRPKIPTTSTPQPPQAFFFRLPSTNWPHHSCSGTTRGNLRSGLPHSAGPAR